MTSTEELEYLAALNEDFGRQNDNALLGARRILNAELRWRGYATDQDHAEGMFPVIAGFILGLLVGLSMAAVWAVQ